MNPFSDDELRLILAVMNQANYPTNVFRIVDGIITKLQIALQPDLQPLPSTPPVPSDSKRPSRAERHRAATKNKKVESPPPAG